MVNRVYDTIYDNRTTQAHIFWFYSICTEKLRDISQKTPSSADENYLCRASKLYSVHERLFIIIQFTGPSSARGQNQSSLTIVGIFPSDGINISISLSSYPQLVAYIVAPFILHPHNPCSLQMWVSAMASIRSHRDSNFFIAEPKITCIGAQPAPLTHALDSAARVHEPDRQQEAA